MGKGCLRSAMRQTSPADDRELLRCLRHRRVFANADLTREGKKPFAMCPVRTDRPPDWSQFRDHLEMSDGVPRRLEIWLAERRKTLL